MLTRSLAVRSRHSLGKPALGCLLFRSRVRCVLPLAPPLIGSTCRMLMPRPVPQVVEWDEIHFDVRLMQRVPYEGVSRMREYCRLTSRAVGCLLTRISRALQKLRCAADTETGWCAAVWDCSSSPTSTREPARVHLTPSATSLHHLTPPLLLTSASPRRTDAGRKHFADQL